MGKEAKVNDKDGKRVCSCVVVPFCTKVCVCVLLGEASCAWYVADGWGRAERLVGRTGAAEGPIG